ncbi:hypothetical protein ACMZ5S_07395 [Streptococcus pluranimalium]
MTDFNNNFERELGWDDEITQDAGEFLQLTPGFYEFTVTNLERGRHTPNPQNPGKLPACNKATLSILIETAEGSTTLTHNLFLHSKMEGMLSAFFGAIGQKKHGEPLKMNWNNIIGQKGVCKVGKRKGTGQYADREFDDIKSMIYVDDVDWTKVLNANNNQSQQPQQQPQTQQTSFFQGNTTQPQQPANGGFGGF